MELPDHQVPLVSPFDNAPAEAPQAKSDVSHVKVSVVSPEGVIVDFRVKMTKSMAKLKHAYAKCTGLRTSGFRFLFHGNQVNDEDTPQQLKMKDDDIVEVVYQTPVSCSSSPVASALVKPPTVVRPKTSAIPSAREVRVRQAQAQDSCIKLMFVGQDFNEVMQFRLMTRGSLGQIKQVYATRLKEQRIIKKITADDKWSEICLFSRPTGLPRSDLRFVFHGNLVNDEETPQQLKMKDHDVINVYQNQPNLYNPEGKEDTCKKHIIVPIVANI